MERSLHVALRRQDGRNGGKYPCHVNLTATCMPPLIHPRYSKRFPVSSMYPQAFEKWCRVSGLNG